eukprot:CAMPEP_0202700966 /NCGR_PEP_ID=MMETSP1385-20130828/14082_1 /ASSEMBLY_ACC=CAM_ASM_000861 /TAXON_ID=933848 /ORGANISM="Elphidium margaritaceum" /LENGTH=191 /DNA_ID=CAMNT_0049358263 /DNA_START=279 /DNA_END=854 /DNA_ORIENTATION=+
MSILRVLHIVIALQCMLVDLGMAGKASSCVQLAVSGKAIKCDGITIFTLKKNDQVRVNTSPTREATYIGSPKDHPWKIRMASSQTQNKAGEDLVTTRMNQAKRGEEIKIYRKGIKGADELTGYGTAYTITKKGWAYAHVDEYDDEFYGEYDENDDEYAKQAYDEMMTKLYMKGYEAGMRAAKQERLSRLLQ